MFVTRFMGGYTENVPPDEFDALPVRGAATLGCGNSASSIAAVCWDGRDVWWPDVRFSSSDSYAVLHCLQGRAKQRGAALPGVREAAN